MRRSLSVVALLFSALVFLVPGVKAQENATIAGTVTDSTGSVVPDATITLSNQATGQVRTEKSNSSGTYVFANLGVGTFNLSAAAKGFQSYARTGIVVNVDQSLKEDVTLTVGSEGQTVTVQADALQVQSETSELSTLITGEQVRQLATNGRNVTALAALGMGVSNNLPAFGGVNALTSANGISFNGTRVSHNIYLLDGGELNDRGCGGCFSSLPSIDALAEFQTLDSNYAPDYGIGSGGTILMVIKSGTHDFHGSAYYFNRNEDYDANNYFTNAAGQGRPVFRLNEPGFNIGGPVWIPHVYNEERKRTFFFVNEEWRRLIQGSSPSIVNTIAANNFPTLGAPFTYNVPANGTVPIVPVTSDPAKLAIYAANGLTPGQPFPGNTIPAALLDPNAVLEMNAGTFPKPNFGASQYISSIPQPTNVREDVIRIDHSITPKLQLMGHYLHDSVTTAFYPPLWQGATYPTVGTTMLNPSYSSIIKLTQTISPNLLNETAFLYSGNTIHLAPIALAGYSFTQPAGWTASSFFPVADNVGARLPQINLGAPYNTQWSSSYFPWKNSYEGYETRDDFSWTKSVHQFKFGFSWLHDPKNQQLQYNTQGTAVFNNTSFSDDSYVNFLLGDVSNFSQLNYLAGKHWVNNNYSFYALDNWHVIPRLTLNLGIRFDGMPHAFERFNQFANFVPADYDTSGGYPLNPADGTINPAFLTASNGGAFYLNGIRSAATGGFPRGVVKNYYKTWQPRIGFAYDLNGDGKTVIRGGFGMFFERVQGNDVYNAALNPPFAYIPSANNVYFSNPNTSALTGLTTAQTFPSNLTNLQYNYQSPGTAMFSLGVQRQLAPSIIAVVQYAGSTGWHQSDDRSINTLPLVDPSFGLLAREAVATNTAYFPDGAAVPNGAAYAPCAPGETLGCAVAPSANLYRNYPGYGTVTQEENTTNFNYNSLQAGVRMDNKHNLTVQLAYTYSHEIDQVSSDLNSLSNPYNSAYDRGSGTLDRRHIFNANYIYNLPFFASSPNFAEKLFLSGWSVSGITVAQSGTPQYITYTGADTLGLGGGTTNRPDLVAPVRYPKTKLAWFSTSSFAAPLAPWAGGNGFGSAGKDAVTLPGLFNWNLALFKAIPLSSHDAGPVLQLRFESFNTFNHTQFQNIDAGTADGNFGQVTSSYDARTLQLGAKLNF